MTEARPGATTPAGPGRASLIRGAGYWRRLGPGIVTGAADDDPSGIGTCSQALRPLAGELAGLLAVLS
jgi:hypothetical protein